MGKSVISKSQQWRAGASQEKAEFPYLLVHLGMDILIHTHCGERATWLGMVGMDISKV